MNCEVNKCNKDAICHCAWGLYEYMRERNSLDDFPVYDKRTDPMNKADLCDAHREELWKTIHGMVNTGIMHFSIKRI